MLRNRFQIRKNNGKAALGLGALALIAAAGIVHGDSTGVSKQAAPKSAAPKAPPIFAQYCFPCHSGDTPQAGVNIEKLAANQTSLADGFQTWQRIATALEGHVMPPEPMPQPQEKDRADAAAWIHTQLSTYAKRHDGDPGRVTVRRLTSGEYAYAIYDLTGYNLETGIDASSDSVGGEGFSNFGDVQFMRDANLEHYLDAAKVVADHAVIGAGPLGFYSDAGKTGFEYSAITRAKDIYAKYGFRTVSGEGGYSYGLGKYGKVFYVTWEYAHRAALGQPNTTLKQFADREDIEVRFARHVLDIVNLPSLSYPLSDVAERWRKLSPPTGDISASEEKARAETTDLQNFQTGWATWFFGRGDAALNGASDESPLIFNDKSLSVDAGHHFSFTHRGEIGGGAQGATGNPKIYLNVASVYPNAKGQGAIIWKNATIAFTPAGAAAALPRVSLRSVISRETAKQLKFGESIDGSKIGPDDFSSGGSLAIEIPMPPGVTTFDIRLDATVGVNRDHIFRVTIADSLTPRGIPTRGLVGDREAPGYKAFKAGVMEYWHELPPNANAHEPTPADKDPAPEPFDPAYNVPEHDEFVNRVKYIRDDRFVWNYLLNDENRAKLDAAWNDIYASFAYHDNYLRLLAQHYNYDLKGRKMADMTPANVAALPPEMRGYVEPLRKSWEEMRAAQAAAKPRHIEDVIRFAGRAWRRPLTETEKQSLRAFYAKALATDPDHDPDQDHVKAIRAVIARVLVAPQFLYKVELASPGTPHQLTSWEMASRLSFFFWSSIPDNELRRAAAANELIANAGLQKQVKRMLADPKARRMSAEFFGQWFGFYRFDQFKGVDTGRFPEFTDEVRSSMYDEAVSFFEYIIRGGRPVSDILYANYDFLNRPLAKYYGVKAEIKSDGPVELVENAGAVNRGGVLRLGAVLTTTSAPLRTSPVKRGDWVLRLVLGTPTPPPPADAGSIPGDPKLFGGLSIRDRLAAHRRNATCATCHARIDPLGFPLEHFDSTGRWRTVYEDGKPIDDNGELPDKSLISGVGGLLDYLHSQQANVQLTLIKKMIGYALGRTVQGSDQVLVDKMLSAGDKATIADLATLLVTSRQFRTIAGSAAATPAVAAATVNPQHPENPDKVGKP